MKKILAFLLVSLMITCFSACSTKSPSSGSFVPIAQSEQVSVVAQKDVFPENTVVKIKQVSSGKSYDTADTALKATAEKFAVYDITATSENVSVQPNGTVKATFAIPENFNLDNVEVVYISDDGKVETLSSLVDKQTKTVTAELSHFSLYAVIEKIEAEVESDTASSEIAEPEDSSKPEESSDPAESSKPAEPSKPAHTHSFAEATCLEAKKCSCGATEGNALGHNYIDDKCSRCGAIDSTYKALLSGAWTVEAVDDSTLYAYSFVFSGEEPNYSVGIGDNLKTLPEEFQNEILNNSADYADSIYKIGNETYYVGRGGGAGIKFEVNKNTVIITELESTNTITMTRTAGDKYTITAVSGDFALQVGAVLSWKEAEISES
ncbi:MAG: hypothetical protein UHH95_03450 [Oscillospiraceae bacterium]|nr:hypothetical protein [Oscillospiraceae bacterium]